MSAGTMDRVMRRFTEWEAVEMEVIRVEVEEKLGRTTLRLLGFLFAESSFPAVLAERLKVTTAAVTDQIDKAEARGWVRRVHQKNDRRKVLVELTEAGRKKMLGIFTGKETA